MKRVFLLIAFIFFVSTNSLAQTEVERLTKSKDLLRQLYSEGLIARIELENAEQELTAAKIRVEETQKAEELAKKADQLAKANQSVKSFVKPTLMPLTKSVMRSTTGNWSLGNLAMVQQFFFKDFRTHTTDQHDRSKCNSQPYGLGPPSRSRCRSPSGQQ